jgi:uroporphyrinogen-III synthase
MLARRIVVTRPEPEASRWVEALQALGLSATALPLIDIRVTPQTTRQAQGVLPSPPDAIMWVSPAAVHAFFKQPSASMPTLSGHCRHLATGPGTVKALQSHGVAGQCIDSPDIASAQFDSEALWQRICHKDWSGKRILIVRGRNAAQPSNTGRDWLATQMRDAGATVREFIAYERAAPAWDDVQCQAAQELLQAGCLWLFSSSQAVIHLRQLLPQASFDGLHCICTHARIAHTSTQAGWSHVHVSKPDLASIASLCHAQ